ncbi:Hypothetical predicted protein [Drosophila guanche]|uniref:Cocaine- and amphetamine-regulated transcript protein n=1 Tax=Drosophila guanche TaxID=7266 RepID=A0A3B0J3A8_DROGU|nr:Hypothetical predicted protein [Drosophila guanche]
MQVKQLSPLLALRLVCGGARCMAQFPVAPVEPKTAFHYQLPHEQLLGEYLELETKCKNLRTALHQSSNKWHSQSPWPQQLSSLECPTGHLMKTCCLHRVGQCKCLQTVCWCQLPPTNRT